MCSKTIRSSPGNQSLAVIELAERQGGCVSTLLITELLRFPLPGQTQEIAVIEAFLESLRRVVFVPADETVARCSAELLREYRSLRFADALHLSTAVVAGAREFWTNDAKLAKVALPNVEVKLLQARD